MKKLIRPVANKRGVALLIAIFSLGLLTFFAMEVSYETNVEYVISSQKINRLRAYYAAKSGAELSLLRILLYKKAVASFGDQLGGNTAMLDPIWNFPFAWPPSQFIPQEELTSITVDSIKSAEKESFMNATYITSIESESGKIDINDLGSEVKELQEQTKQQVLKIFSIEIETNSDFENKYRNTDFELLVNNMIDWVDENQEQIGGGNERSLYLDFLKDNPTEFIPPNQPFKTLDEIRMVAGMRDDFFELLKDKVTVFGIKGINVNFASKGMLKSLDIRITDEIADEIIKRRTSPELGGPFTNETDFLNFLGTLINTTGFNDGGIPLLFDGAYNFRIVSTGEFSKATREITVITYDMDSLVTRMADLLDKQDKDQNQSQQPPTTPPPNNPTGDPNKNKSNTGKGKSTAKKNIPAGKPRIVMWQER